MIVHELPFENIVAAKLLDKEITYLVHYQCPKCNAYSSMWGVCPDFTLACSKCTRDERYAIDMTPTEAWVMEPT